MDMEDELMNDLIIHEAYFQFDNGEPVRFAFLAGGEFSLTLKAHDTEEPEVEFSDGSGKTFRIFLKKSEHGI